MTAPLYGELHRILEPTACLIIMVPIIEGWDKTYENSAITSGNDRDLHFGQSDHVRIYGADFRNRVREAGLRLTEFTAVEPFVSRHGLQRGEKVFIASRSS